MSRRLIAAAFGVLLLGTPVVARAQSSSPPPVKESGSPINDQGSSYNYRSNITGIAPGVPGLKLEVLEFADRLVLTNHTGRTVTVEGYQGEPYARVLANGTVEENTHSPAYYLNQDFYGNVNVPSSASPAAKPDWTVVDRTGQLEWHDHRIHWMSPVLPPQVKDRGTRTKIFDWQVPLQVGTTPATVNGQLFWVPEEGSKTPLGAIVALVAIVFAGLALVFVVRRRRRSTGPPDGEAEAGRRSDRGSPGGHDPPAGEAW